MEVWVEIKKRGCEQKCGSIATVYAGGPRHNDWAGYYCESCSKALQFNVWCRYPDGLEAK